jgi:hypothetical protein
VKLVQPIEIKYEWRYLLLGVALNGTLAWQWLERFRQGPVAEVVTAWKADGTTAIVWDNAPSHKAQLVHDVGVPLIGLPSYSPELNPAERVFEEVRRAIEGEVYGTIERKMAAVESFLTELAGDPARVRRLVRWDWLVTALANSAA